MLSGQRYYVIVNKDTEETLELSDPITGYTETLKFNNEQDAIDYLEDDEERATEYADGKYEIISLKW